MSRYIVEALTEIGPETQLQPEISHYDRECIRGQLAQCIGRPDYLPACEFLLEMALKIRIGVLGAEYLDPQLQAQLVALRHRLMERDSLDLNVDIEPLRREAISARLSVMENLVWGIETQPKIETQHQALVNIVEKALVDNHAESLVLITIGLSSVGIRGERLPLAAKYNIQLLRALIKRPKILILHDALDHKTVAEQQAILEGIRQLMPGMTIIMLKSSPGGYLPNDKVFRMGIDGMVKG